VLWRSLVLGLGIALVALGIGLMASALSLIAVRPPSVHAAEPQLSFSLSWVAGGPEGTDIAGDTPAVAPDQAPEAREEPTVEPDNVRVQALGLSTPSASGPPQPNVSVARRPSPVGTVAPPAPVLALATPVPLIVSVPHPAERLTRIDGADITFYDCRGQGFCGRMANGQVVYEGAAACSYDLPLGTHFYIVGDPTNRIYRCDDRGLLSRTWVDIFWYDPIDGWRWQQIIGRWGTIVIVQWGSDG
jgi:hypothetical protein